MGTLDTTTSRHETGGKHTALIIVIRLTVQGDSFTVPPSNLYYIRNTSKTTTAELYFVLVKDSEVAPPSQD